MMISRKLANRAQNRLQLALSLIQTGKLDMAMDAIHDLSKLINRYLETETEESERRTRENDKR